MSEPGTASRRITDILAGGWIDRWAPPAARPYLRLARLDRPIGAWLLLFPCWWALALAAPPGAWPDWRLMALFAVGAVVMRGAGCTYNDILDRDIDARVARTAGRPIPSGAVSPSRAAIFLVLQLAAGFAILIQLETLAVWLGVASLAFVALYPLMKRWTYWPQAFLGLTFNWGALMGYAAASGGLSLPSILLYAAGILWTLHYDTVYAHQDKEDDALVGVKSTALKFGSDSRRWIAGFAMLAVLLLASCVLIAELAWPAAAALALVALHLAWQVAAVRFDDPADCLAKFRSNRWIGWILLGGIALARRWT